MASSIPAPYTPTAHNTADHISSLFKETGKFSEAQAKAFDEALVAAHAPDSRAPLTDSDIEKALHASNDVAQKDNDDSTQNLTHEEYIGYLDTFTTAASEYKPIISGPEQADYGSPVSRI
jgi:hypothetical protein